MFMVENAGLGILKEKCFESLSGRNPDQLT